MSPPFFVIARVGDAVAPAVPLAGVVAASRIAGDAVQLFTTTGGATGPNGLPVSEHRDGALLGVGQADRLHLHAAERQRVEDAFRRHLPQHRRASAPSSGSSAMAVRARALEDGGAVRRLLRQCGRGERDEQTLR